MPIRAAESGDELGRILGLLERQGCKLDAGRPTLSALVERRERFPVEPEADPLVQVEILLLCGEAEVSRSKLEQLPPARSVASMMGGSARVAIARRHVPGQPVQEEPDGLVTGGVHDALVVVEHEHELVLDQAQVARQERQHGSKDVGLRRVQGELRSALELRLDGSESLDDPRPEENRIVVGRLERERRERPLLDRPPLVQQGRLAEPGRRRQEHELLRPSWSVRVRRSRGRRSGERRARPAGAARIPPLRGAALSPACPRGDAAHPCLADFALAANGVRMQAFVPMQN